MRGWCRVFQMFQPLGVIKKEYYNIIVEIIIVLVYNSVDFEFYYQAFFVRQSTRHIVYHQKRRAAHKLCNVYSRLEFQSRSLAVYFFIFCCLHSHSSNIIVSGNLFAHMMINYTARVLYITDFNISFPEHAPPTPIAQKLFPRRRRKHTRAASTTAPVR